MVTTRPPKTIVKLTALGPAANTDTKLLIHGLFQKGRVLAQDGVRHHRSEDNTLGLDDCKAPRPLARSQTQTLSYTPKPRRVESPAMGKASAIPKVGGLHHYYTRRAA